MKEKIKAFFTEKKLYSGTEAQWVAVKTLMAIGAFSTGILIGVGIGIATKQITITAI